MDGKDGGRNAWKVRDVGTWKKWNHGAVASEKPEPNGPNREDGDPKQEEETMNHARSVRKTKWLT